MRTFGDRSSAGRELSGLALPLASEVPLVVGLTRGGVVVAREVAALLGAPLEIWAVEELRSPDGTSLGAIAEGDGRIVDPTLARRTGVGEAELAAIEQRAQVEIERLVRACRDRPRGSVRGRTVIVVADVAATCPPARAAIHAMRQEKPHRLVLAVVVGTRDCLDALRRYTDGLLCVEARDDAASASAAFAHLAAPSDAELRALLAPSPPAPRVALQASRHA